MFKLGPHTCIALAKHSCLHTCICFWPKNANNILYVFSLSPRDSLTYSPSIRRAWGGLSLQELRTQWARTPTGTASTATGNAAETTAGKQCVCYDVNCACPTRRVCHSIRGLGERVQAACVVSEQCGMNYLLCNITMQCKNHIQ